MSTARSRAPFEPNRADLAKLFDKVPPHAHEAECALLGSMILDSRVIGDVIEIISDAGDFYFGKHSAIFDALVFLYDHHESIDIVQIKHRLDDQKMLDDVGGVDYLLKIAQSVPDPTNAKYYAKLVRDKAVLRKLIDAAGKILHDAYTSRDPVQNLLDEAEREIFDIADGPGGNDVATLETLLQETYARLEAQEGRHITGLASGFFELDEMTAGLQPGELIIVAARPSMGKAQPMDAKVLTLEGWTRMGDLKVGQRLASVDGKASKVVGIFPQGRRPVYRITFADGRSTECCDEHLWRVGYRGWPEPRVVTTAKLRDMLGRKRYRNRVWIETFGGDFGSDDELPLDPWLLGVLIGDGSLGGTSVRFSSADSALVERVAQTVGAHMTITAAGGYDYRITQTGGAHQRGQQGVRANPVKSALQDLGLWGCDATSKFIPSSYLRASRESRMRLIAGLVDTDGWVEKWGSLRYATSSEQLAKDVVELIRSLGGTGSYRRKSTAYSYQGARRLGQPTFVCNLQHPDARDMATVEGKKARLAEGRSRSRRLNVVAIEPMRTVDTQCIAVSHPSHLYITDDFIVTHNTAFAVNIAEHVSAVDKQPAAVFSLEMSKQQLAQRLLCSHSGVNSHDLRRNMIRTDDWPRLHNSVSVLSEAPLFIDDTPGLTLLQLRAKARRMAAQHHIKLIVIDYLQLMSAPGSESRQQEVSEISRGIKAMARDLRLPVICLSQLNRQSEGREGHRPRMSDLRESGSIEQDADVVMMLHREEYYHINTPEWAQENPDKVGVAEIIICKQRNGPTGVVNLKFDGSTTRFQNLSHQAPPGGY